MAVTVHADGEQTTSAATEHTLVSTATTAGVFTFRLDLNDMVNGDSMIIRIKEKIRSSSGTQRVMWYFQVDGLQGNEKLWVSPALPLLNGWAFSIEANATIVVPWDVLKMA